MADPSSYSTPRWVKIFALIAVVLVLLVVIVMLIIGGDHGPGRHTPSGGAGDAPTTLVVTYRPENMADSPERSSGNFSYNHAAWPA
ncbi:MAG TPA: hypothetical protein PLD25_26905 [Chloroflexota bacterium]|nr:hypothetical protein [Chloroflexota bacterium]HUM67235.1 hypothetical protein [Chloroflexota bacterium]